MAPANQKIHLLYPKNLWDASLVLTLLETGLGSLLHAFRIPFRGQLMSLSQGLILCRYLEFLRLNPQSHHPIVKSPYWQPSIASQVAAVMKSLSPVGRRLMPMLAISTQGFLFSLGSFVSVYLGMFLLCLWPFLQPILMYYFLFGQTLIKAVMSSYQKLNDFSSILANSLLGTYLLVVGLKILLGLGLVWATRRSLKLPFFDFYLEKALAHKPVGRNFKSTNPFVIYFKTLFSIPFLISLGLVFLFFIYSGVGAETQGSHATQTEIQNQVAWIWIALRPFAVLFLLVFVLPYLPILRLTRSMRSVRVQSFLQILAETQKRLREF
jgi:hypothetical protein